MKTTLSRRAAVYLAALAAVTAFTMGTSAAIAEDIPLAIKGYDPVAYCHRKNFLDTGKVKIARHRPEFVPGQPQLNIRGFDLAYL